MAQNGDSDSEIPYRNLVNSFVGAYVTKENKPPAMSRPTTPQYGSGNRGSRGSRRPRRAFTQHGQRGRGGQGGQSAQRGQGHSQGKQNMPQQQPSQSVQVFDWFDEEYKTVDPNEKQDSHSSRSSSPLLYSNRGSYRGQRGQRNHGQRRRDSSGNRQEDKSSRYSKFFQLTKLSEMNGNEIATEISDNPDFKILLDSWMNNDRVVMTLRTLAKLEEASFTRIVINILNDTCDTKFFDSLEHFLVDLTTQPQNYKGNKFYWEDVHAFWEQLHSFCKIIVNLVPLEAHDKLLPLLKLIRQYVIDSLKTEREHEDLQSRFTRLYHQLKDKGKNARAPGNELLQDFRNLSIVPTVEDLNDHNPYIRPCKTRGAYESVDHYLDVQFRLLREDFICPLRSGIQEYKRSLQTDRLLTYNSDIRIFQKVKFIGPTVVKNKVGVTVFFGVMPKMNWIRSKLFMYGSLLCLTNDNFESVIFATVAERDPTLLAKGELIIEPCVGTQITQDMYSHEFIMVESKVYFLPYYHTLSSLRYMTEENFPMKRYVVDAKSNPKSPKYLDKYQVYEYKGLRIPVMDGSRWPGPKHLKLNQSQYDAFKSALQQELSVLHGPPGTGKTFMALQIASTLLNNSSCWYNPDHPTPMIVVCLTNHALDQFLEGILEYTDSLVRIGEQSKNPNLTKYKLKAVREEYFKDERKKHRAWQRMGYYQRQLKQILYTLSNSYLALKAFASSTSIVSPTVLSRYCSDDELRGLTTRDLLTRLFGEYDATLALEIKAAASKSSQSKDNDESESEDENVDADDDLEVASVVHKNQSDLTCLELSHLDEAIEKTREDLNQWDPQDSLANHIRNELSIRLCRRIGLRETLQEKLRHHPLEKRSLLGMKGNMDLNWEIYCHWVSSSYEKVKEHVAQLEEEYQEMSSQLNDFKQMTDLEVMRNSKVVGLTTTGAARLHESLRALQSPIVLVEEAAEILEAHVICSLTEHCQQVILIGDHKQLRPKPATYNLEINYNMNISLFERIVNMRDKCTQLVIQHRMRPEIARLISPSIYERLENHPSVLEYPAVKGVKNNLFFLHHENRESGSSDNESMSNQFEVKFLLAFAQYLIQQGYAPEHITILCTYSGQLFKFKEAKKSMQTLRNVRVTTVDNYQGEENRIILLSLVRNNSTGNVGFLKIENRVCVALSRAREGLFIMGNMKNLVTKNEIWPKIKQSLEDNDSIGDSLVLKCQVHPDQLTEIKKPTDFRNSDGGCTRRCDTPLQCGHTCQKICHLSDRDHKKYICKQRCLKKCPNGHPCKHSCNTACRPCEEIVSFELKCGHTVDLPCYTNMSVYQCTTEVKATLPCGHIVTKPCFRNSLTYPCPQPCNAQLRCGHNCQRECHVNNDIHHLTYVCKEDCKKSAMGCQLSHPCPKKCYEPCSPCVTKVVKTRSCGHTHKIGCSEDVEKTICTRRCKRDLPCGHKCRDKCYMPCGRCPDLVDKIVPECGHKVEIPCHLKPTTEVCRGECQRTLKCGHPCKAQCCEPCTTRCEYPRPLPEPALCQHVFPVPCYKIEAGLAEYADKLLQHCTTPCTATLPCGHKCSGSCGSCKQGRIHQLCREQCNKINICGHRCEALCKDLCRPCQKNCCLRCEHQECGLKCGTLCATICPTLCTKCLAPCTWKCKHLQCTKLCFEICDRESCNEPCPNKLNCGHRCIGFCGDPCPQLCRICDKKDLPTFTLDKNQPEARFVYLPDCGHSIESNYLDWIWQNSYRIGIKECPLCKTRITYCSRYTNQMKRECQDIAIVEQQISLRLQALQSDQQKIVGDISLIENEYESHFPGFSAHKELFESLKKLVNQRKTIGIGLLKDISTKLTIAGMIVTKSREITPLSRNVDEWNVVLNQMIMLTSSLPTNSNISLQMCEDIKNELSRLHYMIQLCKLENENGFNWRKNALQVRVICLGLLNLKRFTRSSSDAIYKQLLELKKSLNSSVNVNELQPINVRIIGLEKEDWYRCPNGHVCVKKCDQCLPAPSAPLEQKLDYSIQEYQSGL